MEKKYLNSYTDLVLYYLIIRDNLNIREIIFKK